MRFLRSLALALALGTASCFAYDKPDKAYPHYYAGKDEKWLYKDYDFIPTNVDNIKNKNYLPPLHPSYGPKAIIETDFQRRKVNALDFIRRSNSEATARHYVQAGLEHLLEKYQDGKIKGDEVALADHAISLFRKDISRDKGRGKYTLKYEGLEDKIIKLSVNGMSLNLKYKIISDSRQTLSEFISHYKDHKAYLGDCDDFAIAVLSSYEIMREIASQKKGAFWDKLDTGLKRIQVAFVVEQGHAINFLIYYNKDFSRAKVVPIEPQLYSNDDIEQNVIVNDGTQLVHIIRKHGNNGIIVEKNLIKWLYNSTASYKKNDKTLARKP
ncbi:MAG: hypothetical protein V1906_01220 [Candidatus Woesearchaeota archaeon]